MELQKTSILLLLLSTALALLSSSSESQAAAPAAGGQWKLLRRNLGISSMHMQLLHTGRIVAFDRTDAGPSNISLPSGRRCLRVANRTDCSAHSVEFDPSDRSLRPLTVTTETWCSSGSLSPNGTLVQTGGYGDLGDRAVRYFSPCDTCDWVEHAAALANRRWYSTNQILPDERIIVVGGRKQFNYEFVPKDSSLAVFDLPFLEETSDQWENNLYPFVHLSTDGHLFIFANTKSILFDHVSNRVLRNYPEMPGGVSRNYPSTGSSLLLPLALAAPDAGGVVKAEVMVCGGTRTDSFSYVRGGTYLPASSSCGRLAITEESPEWLMEEMPMGRVMGDMIMLPTGDVLIVNGAARGTAGWGNARDPVLSPVLYRTGAFGGYGRRFETMSPSTIPRLYHSTAHLIPDGRVLVGGSNPNAKYQFDGVLFPTELSLEAFYPPYLGSEAGRPNIAAVVAATEPGDSIAYGQRFSVSFSLEGECRDVVYVTMVAPSFTTHSLSMNQRLLVLEVAGLDRVKGVGLKADVFAPASAVLAPPGYYMLFVVHGGVPSRAKWIHIRGQ